MNEEFEKLPIEQQRLMREFFMFLIHNRKEWDKFKADYLPKFTEETKANPVYSMMMRYLEAPSDTKENKIGQALTGYKKWYLALTK